MFIRTTKFGKEGLELARSWVIAGTSYPENLPERNQLWPILVIGGADEQDALQVDAPVGEILRTSKGSQEPSRALVTRKRRLIPVPDQPEQRTLQDTGIAWIVLSDSAMTADILAELRAAKLGVRDAVKGFFGWE